MEDGTMKTSLIGLNQQCSSSRFALLIIDFKEVFGPCLKLIDRDLRGGPFAWSQNRFRGLPINTSSWLQPLRRIPTRTFDLFGAEKSDRLGFKSNKSFVLCVQTSKRKVDKSVFGMVVPRPKSSLFDNRVFLNRVFIFR